MKKLPIKSYLIIALMVMLPISVAADESPDAYTLSWLEYRSNHPELFKFDSPFDSQKADKPIPGKWDLYAQTDDSSAAKTGSGEDEGQPEMDMAAMAEAINNPLGELWLLFTQNDTSWWKGDITNDEKIQNAFVFQPVLSMQMTQNWRLLFRPTFPVLSFETVTGVDFPSPEDERPSPPSANFDRKTGLGDIVLWTALSNKYKPPNVFGFGPTVMMDTATSDELGTGKWSAGPMVVAMHLGEKWIAGGIAQHWWDFAGDDDRADVNLTDLQYIIKYRVTPETNIGISPNIRVNWDADDSDNKWTVPIGIGFDTFTKIGPVPMKWGVEVHGYPVTPDIFGPQWQIRLFFVPVVPAPKWSKKPLFGN